MLVRGIREARRMEQMYRRFSPGSKAEFYYGGKAVALAELGKTPLARKKVPPIDRDKRLPVLERGTEGDARG